MGVVGKHEGFDLLGGDARIREVRSAQAFATQYRKPDFDKTQPGRVYWQEVEHECPLRMGVQPTRHFGRPVRADRVQDQMDRLAHGCLLIEQRQQFAELARTVLETDHAAHLAIVDPEASQRSTVPFRLYSNSRRAGRARAGGRRGTGGWSGAVGWRTPIPGFSSTQNSGPSVGGLRSNSITATALVATSGSRSFIQVLK